MATRPKAAGESGGRAPLLAAMDVPDFTYLVREELHGLLHLLRDSTAVHLYLILRVNCVFKTGEFLGSYARLVELMTPPQPERGPRRSGPSYKQCRSAVDALVAIGLVKRAKKNEELGQLRLRVVPMHSRSEAQTAQSANPRPVH